jgi:uncharacterized membrane protein YphA (DoxX/SURF4 family)
MKRIIPSKLAEIVFALVLGYFGYTHFKNAASMGGYVPKFMPGDGKIWIYVVGAGLLLSAIAILIDVQKTLAGYLLAAMLLIIAFSMHFQHFIDGNDAAGGFLKDTAMAMGAILIGNRDKSQR